MYLHNSPINHTQRHAIIVAVATISMVINTAYGQIEPSHRSFSFGLSANEYGYDPGIGIEISTPGFFNSRLCVRLKGNITWLEEYKATYDHWAKYRSISAIIVYNFNSVEGMRVYSGMGPYAIFPGNKFSDSRMVEGVICETGVELSVVTTPAMRITYYFSGGLAYINAYAEKLENNPRYGNGFVFSNGFRFYFTKDPK